MTISAEVQESIDQFAGAWAEMARRCPNPLFATGGGWRAAFLGVPIPFFNVVFLDTPVRDADDLLARANSASEWAAGTGHAWLLCVCSELLPEGCDGAAALAEAGFQPAMPLTGMIADDLTPPPPVPEGLSFRTAGAEDTRLAMAGINGAAYGMDLSDPAGAAPLVSEAMWSGANGIVGYAGGQPVSCTATFPVDGRRYVAWVATLPEYQRRGFAGAVMRQSLAEAAAAMGPVRTVLHATPAGRPVYERMGYRAVANHWMYALGAAH